ncbi:MAG: hypothetical protein R3301_01665 [Saprospiraceae bacterium]|nr:hypothetical protein [Saprospiraceae bacterium]
MESLQLQVPSWYLLLCVLAGLIFAAVLYFRDRTFQDQKPLVRWAMTALRFLSVTLLSALLLSPFLKTYEQTVQEPIVIVAEDNSSSVMDPMDAADSAAYRSALDQLADNLGEEYDVRRVRFGEAVEEDSLADFTDQVTDIAQVLEQIGDVYRDQNLGAVILATDGLYNRGKSPLYVNQKIAAPIHTIALGDTTVKTDLWVQRVLHNRISFLGDRFPVQVDISARRLNGRTATLTTQKIEGGNARTLDQRDIRIDSDQFFTTVEIILDADQAGVNRYRTRLSGIGGESQYNNNSRDFYVEVIDGRLEILVLAHAPHPDLAAIREMIVSNDNYNVTVSLYKDFVGNATEYDLVILHQLPSAQHDISALIAEMDAANTARLFILGESTNLPRFNNAQEFLAITGAQRTPNEVTAIVDKSFQLFTVPENLEGQIQTFAPMSAPFGDYGVDPSASVYLYQKIGNVDTQYPLILFGESGSTKVGILAAEGIWKWRLYDFLQNSSHELSNTLLSKSVQFLTVKDDRRRFRASPEKNLYTDNEAISFEAELYNQSYELVNDPEAFLVVRDDAGNEYDYTFNKTDKSYAIDIGKFAVGDYRYTAYTDYAGQRQQVNGRFSVQPIQLESYVTTADHSLLHALSRKYGGDVYYPQDLAALGDRLLADDTIKPVLYQSARNQPLLHLKWLFLVLLGLLGLEWFMRRYFGGY